MADETPTVAGGIFQGSLLNFINPELFAEATRRTLIVVLGAIVCLIGIVFITVGSVSTNGVVKAATKVVTKGLV